MTNFDQMGLHPKVLSALKSLSFTSPTPVQAEAIPHVLNGDDVLVQAKTGTGKTAAFGLPLLSNVDLSADKVSALILAPTRELAIQVAEAIESFAKELKGLNIAAIYGGADYRTQIRALKRGAHIVVGTPGRVMDHMEKGTLDVSNINTLVLDEADEMLKMGFIDDVEWVLKHTPDDVQIALFSATMPPPIKKITSRYLKNPQLVSIKSEERSLSSIEQVYSVVFREHKFEALARFLTVEHTNAAIIFTRTRADTNDVADRLSARGYRAAAINGDMDQPLREKVIQNLKKGILDIVVATDVAARGLDVERIEYVVNYDLPFDVESYVHRIGRTGRAGRTGKSLTLASPKDTRMMHTIKRVTGYDIKEVDPPSIDTITEHAEKGVFENIGRHGQTIEDINPLINKVKMLQKAFECDAEELAAVLLSEKLDSAIGQFEEVTFKRDRSERRERSDRRDRSSRDTRRGASSRPERERRAPRTRRDEREAGMTRCIMNLGRDSDVKPSDVVGFIANRCKINRKMIGRINIGAKATHIDIADKVAKSVVKELADAKFKRQVVNFKLG